MAIEIVPDGPPIRLTESEHAELIQMYHSETRYHDFPPSFEAWVRDRKERQGRPLIGHPLTGKLLDLSSDAPLAGGTACDGDTCEVCQ